jgi:hypothetical protein
VLSIDQVMPFHAANSGRPPSSPFSVAVQAVAETHDTLPLSGDIPPAGDGIICSDQLTPFHTSEYGS